LVDGRHAGLLTLLHIWSIIHPLLDTSNLPLARRVGKRTAEKRLAGRGQREPVRLLDASAMSVRLCVRRAQVDLSGCDVGMPKFLPQGFDVNALLMPPRGVQHAKGMAGLLRFLNRVTRIVRLLDE
jgi:hypothetical protein